VGSRSVPRLRRKGQALLAEESILERLEHIWWVLHHSEEKNRMAVSATCYIDESGTDSSSAVAVVGGVMLNQQQFFWLDVEWRKCLCRHHIPWPLHMREFGPRGKLKDLRSEERRALFTDAVKVINETKGFSVVSTLNSDQYRTVFKGISSMSMYAACFANLAMLNGLSAQMSDYQRNIAYVLDEGNDYKHEILEAYPLLRNADLRVGSLTFESDNGLSALQVADVVSWATRRKQASELRSGFEPLTDLFDDKHSEVPYEPEWMLEVAEKLRAKMQTE